MVEMHLRLLRDECDRKTGIWDTVDEELTRLEKQIKIFCRAEIKSMKRTNRQQNNNNKEQNSKVHRHSENTRKIRDNISNIAYLTNIASKQGRKKQDTGR
ncbi:hypothetical protein WR25_24422 [Diploscapter pachys]|uniref:Uncharacterized protein n=1 Tax=Diploscapter pachys TaxID=2018661 RepID=A0A2A2LIR3_9BILA|nr:hypothetical protein WR25_24422 [Diploscapter pachys]